MESASFALKEIDIKKYKKGKRISKGGFGVVYQAIEKETNQIYAAKVIDCDDDEEQCTKMIEREIGILINTDHPTIIRFIGYSKTDFQDENNVAIIMELAQNGSLASVIKKIQDGDGPADFTNTTKQIIIAGVACGMKYLHEQNIIHRDLKPGNVLLNSLFHPLITDFGMSKQFEEGHSISQSQFGGTMPYEAPEILNNDPYNRKVDVYAFAILMYEVVTESPPYPSLESGKMKQYTFMDKVIREKYRPEFSDPIKKPIKELIELCWSDDPEERPNFGEIFDLLINKSGKKSDENCILEDVVMKDFYDYITEITGETFSIEDDKESSEKNSEEEGAEEEGDEEETDETKKEEEDAVVDGSEEKVKIVREEPDKNEKGESVKVKEEETVKLSDDLSLIYFNSLSLTLQQQTAEEISNTPEYKNSDFFILLNSLIKYLLKVDGMPESCIQVTSESKVDASDLRVNLQFTATEILHKNEKLESIEFIDILKDFKKISIELRYPSKTFNTVYDKLVEMSNSDKLKNKVFISVFISKISKIDKNFVFEENINYIAFDSHLKSINGRRNDGSFHKCSPFLDVSIPSSVEKIGKNAFKKCSKLKQINFEYPSSLSSIEKFTFCCCELLKQITIPSSVESIKSHAFDGCPSLVEVLFEDGSKLASINRYAFNGCPSLKKIEIPNSLELIGTHAFNECSSLSHVVLSNKLKSIQSHTFCDCSALEQILMPSSVDSFGESAFHGCSSLTIISIPYKVKVVSKYCFMDCSAIEMIWFDNSLAEKIDKFAFCNCSSITELRLPSTLSTICEFAFSECSSLKKLDIPDSVTSIGKSAFAQCSSLEKVEISSSIEKIEESTFAKCSSLKKLEIPSSVKIIGKSAFAGCSSLEALNVPQTVAEIGNLAFSKCSSLKQIVCSSAATKIGNSAFSECTSLANAIIPASTNIEEIGISPDVTLERI